MNAWRRFAVLPIRFYQRVISPLKPPSCRFDPTCSTYAYDAIVTHGLIKGWLLAIWRILRCQPFSDGGWDPVPDRGAWRGMRKENAAEDPAADEAGDDRTRARGQERG